MSALFRGELHKEFFRRLVGANIANVTVDTNGINETKVDLLEVGSWVDQIIAKVALSMARDMIRYFWFHFYSCER
jgi:hypothetical protein